MTAIYVQGRKRTLRRTIMGQKSVLPGFDYRSNRPSEKSRQEWRGELRELVAKGGRRRVAHGETLGPGPDGLIRFEIYDNVSI